jgi:hypothetical protein
VQRPWGKGKARTEGLEEQEMRLEKVGEAEWPLGIKWEEGGWRECHLTFEFIRASMTKSYTLWPRKQRRVSHVSEGQDEGVGRLVSSEASLWLEVFLRLLLNPWHLCY